MNAPPPKATTAGLPAGNGTTGGQLDFRVGVQERQAQSCGEPAADRGLAGTHQADQHDSASPERIGDRQSLAQGGGVA
jgi:hypothetical protein